MFKIATNAARNQQDKHEIFKISCIFVDSGVYFKLYLFTFAAKEGAP